MRRNSLADFESINRNGKIAMKLEEGDRIVRVAICRPVERAGGRSAPGGDVAPVSQPTMPTSTDIGEADARARVRRARQRPAHHGAGRCIRFPVDDVRLFKGRDSDGRARHQAREGRRGHLDGHPAPRRRPLPASAAAYLKQALAVRRAQGAEVAEGAVEPDAEVESRPTAAVELSPSATPSFGATEQFVLTVSERGFGKRSSSYEYRISGRGGKGIVAMIVNDRNGRLSPRSRSRTATRSCW